MNSYSRRLLIVIALASVAGGILFRPAPTKVHAQTSSTCSSRPAAVVTVNLDEILAGNDLPVHICAATQDSILWYSDTYKFKVIAVSPKDSNASANAFYRIFPNSSDNFQQTVSSGPPRPGSAGHTYKAAFQLENGRIVDPDVIIDPPPPPNT